MNSCAKQRVSDEKFDATQRVALDIIISNEKKNVCI